MPKYPPPQKKVDYELVRVDDWIDGIIEEVELDNEHKFIWKGTETIQPGVRFKFKLAGYDYPHYSRWNKFNTGSKANLYKKYIVSLVDDPEPNMMIDLDDFVGFKIKTMWTEKKDAQGRIWQNTELIRPLEDKLVNNPEWKKHEAVEPAPDATKEAESVDDSSVPF